MFIGDGALLLGLLIVERSQACPSSRGAAGGYGIPSEVEHCPEAGWQRDCDPGGHASFQGDTGRPTIGGESATKQTRRSGRLLLC